MLLAFAVLLIHPQLAAATSLTAGSSPIDTSIMASAPVATMAIEGSSTTSANAVPVVAQPIAEADAALPAAPAPVVPVTVTAPEAFLKAGSPMVVSVKELQAENHRKLLLWRGLAIASSGAATFDAMTTRYAITTTGARELDPLLRPFAGNASLFAAIQVAPALLDFAGHKMMYSRHPLLRKTWWVPQSGSFVLSMFCGAHNLAYH